MRKRIFAVDFDDYCDNSMEDTLPVLKRLREKYPNFTCTLFTIPMRTSPGTIAAAKSLGDWVSLAPHGYFHTKGECLAWTPEEAEDKIKIAAEMGIDSPTFRAPAWLLDIDVYRACKKLNYTVASHRNFRIPNTGAWEYVYNDPAKRAKGVRGVHGHCTPVSGNFIKDMEKDGRLGFGMPRKCEFENVFSAGVVVKG